MRSLAHTLVACAALRHVAGQRTPDGDPGGGGGGLSTGSLIAIVVVSVLVLGLIGLIVAMKGCRKCCEGSGGYAPPNNSKDDDAIDSYNFTNTGLIDRAEKGLGGPMRSTGPQPSNPNQPSRTPSLQPPTPKMPTPRATTVGHVNPPVRTPSGQQHPRKASPPPLSISISAPDTPADPVVKNDFQFNVSEIGSPITPSQVEEPDKEPVREGAAAMLLAAQLPTPNTGPTGRLGKRPSLNPQQIAAQRANAGELHDVKGFEKDTTTASKMLNDAEGKKSPTITSPLSDTGKRLSTALASPTTPAALKKKKTETTSPPVDVLVPAIEVEADTETEKKKKKKKVAPPPLDEPSEEEDEGEEKKRRRRKKKGDKEDVPDDIMRQMREKEQEIKALQAALEAANATTDEEDPAHGEWMESTRGGGAKSAQKKRAEWHVKEGEEKKDDGMLAPPPQLGGRRKSKQALRKWHSGEDKK